MGLGMGLGIGLGGSRNWTPQSISSKLLFWGKVSEISGGQMPNKVGSDYLTVSGSNYQCPNTSPYNNADADYVWFNADDTQRSATTSELIAYDFSKTLVKYDDDSPNTLREIIIIKSGETLTEAEDNAVRDYMKLSIWWDGTLSLHGAIKSNRTVSRSVWVNIYNTLSDGNTAGWYDATDASQVTKDGSNNVTALKNKLGVTSTDLTTYGGTPKWSADGILFDGIDDYLKRTYTLVQPIFIYVVYRDVTFTNGDKVLDGGASSAYLTQYSVSPLARGYAGTSSSPITTNGTNFGIVRLLFNGASSKIIANSGTPVTGNFGTNSMGGLSLGVAANASSGFGNVEIKEVVVRRVADSAENEAIIYNYLKNKHSIA